MQWFLVLSRVLTAWVGIDQAKGMVRTGVDTNKLYFNAQHDSTAAQSKQQ